MHERRKLTTSRRAHLLDNKNDREHGWVTRPHMHMHMQAETSSKPSCERQLMNQRTNAEGRKKMQQRRSHERSGEGTPRHRTRREKKERERVDQQCRLPAIPWVPYRDPSSPSFSLHFSSFIQVSENFKRLKRERTPLHSPSSTVNCCPTLQRSRVVVQKQNPFRPTGSPPTQTPEPPGPLPFLRIALFPSTSTARRCPPAFLG
mmetsp:Transcript_2796/g.5790  ORF Transcript_2796/g.5790 Transcript_2796/m.5790 type:complete len:204 (+) Transcript_2796:247-858(+)